MKDDLTTEFFDWWKMI